MIIMGSSSEEISAIDKDEPIGKIADGNFFDIGYIFELVFVDRETGKIAGRESEDFDISPAYDENPSRYFRAWIIV